MGLLESGEKVLSGFGSGEGTCSGYGREERIWSSGPCSAVGLGYGVMVKEGNGKRRGSVFSDFLIPILQIRKPVCREMKPLTQGHKVIKVKDRT